MLVADGQERSAVAACHALKRAGYRVGAASCVKPAPAHWSRAVDEKFDVPDPREEPEGYAAAIAGIAAERSFDVVMPGTDASMLALSRHRHAFDGPIDPGWPEEKVVEAAMRKDDMHEVAADVGLVPPDSVLCESSEDALVAAAELGFPLVLKPRSSVREQDDSLRQKGSVMVWDRETLDRELPEVGLPCVVQRREVGPLISFAGVIAEARMLAVVVSRYRRTWPPDAGSVSFSETISPSADLIERVTALLAQLNWQGIFELELIQTGPRRFAAIDLNPRLYGSLALAIRAGVALPVVWCDWLLKDKVTEQIAEPGYHYRWEDAELCNLAHRLRRGRLSDAAAILRPRRRTAHALFRWHDPLPLLARAINDLGHPGHARIANSGPETSSTD